MTRTKAFQLINSGTFTAQELGALSHRILDWCAHGTHLFVKTPHLGWHVATPRERRLLHRPV